jgi:hypothetical protein
MPEQMTFELPTQPVMPLLRLVPKPRAELGPAPEQLCIDFTAPVLALVAKVPRMPIRSTTCAGATIVVRDGIALPAAEWAARLGLKWQTVKMRRMRGANWTEALAPELKRSTFMSGWKMHG